MSFHVYFKLFTCEPFLSSVLDMQEITSVLFCPFHYLSYSCTLYPQFGQVLGTIVLFGQVRVKQIVVITTLTATS